VLDSLFPALTASTVALLVPAVVALLRTARHAHVAEPGDATRRVRVVASATLLALVALGTSALTGSGPGVAAGTAVVVAGSVLVTARVHRRWAVRGLVVWALVIVATAGLVGWLLHRTLVSSASAPGLMAAGLAWLVLLYAVTRLRGSLRDDIEALATRDAEAPSGTGSRSRLVPAAVAVASAALVAVVTAPGGPGTAPGGPPSQAGRTSTPRPAATTAPSGSGPGGASASQGAPASEPVRTRGSRRGSEQTPPSRSATSAPTGPEATAGASTPTTAQTTSGGEAAPDAAQATKTPGWVKNSDKRPSGAPSPTPGGPGRP
jgi:hypothetical protein